MRRLHRLPVVMLILVAGAIPARAQGPREQLSPVAAAYLKAALDTLQAVALGRDAVPWRIVRDSAFLLATGARRPSDTYGAIDWALHRVNKHSFLQANPPGAVAELLAGRYGYIHIPQRGGPATGLADSLYRAVTTLQDSGACGWIVDLRGNGGGNMWPMLAGIGPLLGDTVVGQFGAEPGADKWYYREGVAGILHLSGALDTVSHVTIPPVTLRQPAAPVAVLLDAETGSSGEALAIAFRGRTQSRSFGSPTAGYTSVNRGSRLSDGANMAVTTGFDADRQGVLYVDRVTPDTLVPGPPPGWPFPTDTVGATAMRWLAAQPGCHGP